MALFLRWMEEQGVHVSDVICIRAPAAAADASAAAAGGEGPGGEEEEATHYAVYARSAGAGLKSGELVCSIPKSACLTRLNTDIADLIEAADIG